MQKVWFDQFEKVLFKAERKELTVIDASKTYAK